MKLFISLLAVIAISAAAFFSYNKLTQAEDHNEQLAQLKIDIQTSEQTKAERLKSQKKENDKKDSLSEQTATATANNKLAEQRQKELNNELSGINRKTASLKAEFDKTNEIIEEIKAANPELVRLDPSEIPAFVIKQEERLKSLNESLEKANEQISIVETSIKENKEATANIEAALEERRQRIASNTKEVIITAVNNGWDFVVFHNSAKLQPKDRLIVTRGDRYIGKIVVDKIENGQTIANFIPETIAPGVQIRVGDRAMRESPVIN